MFLPHITLHYSKLAVQLASCIAFLLRRSGLFFRTGYNPSGHQNESKVENAWIKLSPMLSARMQELNQRYIGFKILKLHLTLQSLYHFAFQIKQRERRGHALIHSQIISVSFLQTASLLYYLLTLQLLAARPRAISMKFDDNTDCETIVLPDIPPDIEFVKGRIICVEEEHLSPGWSTTRLKNKRLAVIMLSNISQGSSLQ